MDLNYLLGDTASIEISSGSGTYKGAVEPVNFEVVRKQRKEKVEVRAAWSWVMAGCWYE